MQIKQGDDKPAPRCPKCGKPMRYRDNPDGKPREVCDACKTSRDAGK